MKMAVRAAGINSVVSMTVGPPFSPEWDLLWAECLGCFQASNRLAAADTRCFVR